jgi:hypothetical protein
MFGKGEIIWLLSMCPMHVSVSKYIIIMYLCQQGNKSIDCSMNCFHSFRVKWKGFLLWLLTKYVCNKISYLPTVVFRESNFALCAFRMLRRYTCLCMVGFFSIFLVVYRSFVHLRDLCLKLKLHQNSHH